MARAAKATKVTNKSTTGSKSGGLAAPAVKAPGSRAKAIAPAVQAGVAGAPEAKLGKSELRALVEKLEGANATLRAKNREANRSAKTAAARIAELEGQVAQLDKKLTSQATPAKTAPKASATRQRRQSHGTDPGDSAPSSVAVEAAVPFDDEVMSRPEQPAEPVGGQ